MIRKDRTVPSPIVKRSIKIAGHRTSVSLEDQFWDALREIAINQHLTVSELVTQIDRDREEGELSSALRLFVIAHYQGTHRPARQ
jgi:predicted DNA-binding ribbon-helix-helix protein